MQYNTMSSKVTILLVLFLQSIFALASDPDPVTDFCIADPESSSTCKSSSTDTVEDFVFSGLNTLGVSLSRGDFDVGGINVPHIHPRATEIGFVLEGKVYAGFVDSNNKVFAKVVEKGEVMVFPRGLIHFQMNVGDTPAAILGSFNSQNPGVLRVPNALFSSEIKEQFLEKAFGLSSKEITKLRRKFTPPAI